MLSGNGGKLVHAHLYRFFYHPIHFVACCQTLGHGNADGELAFNVYETQQLRLHGFGLYADTGLIFSSLTIKQGNPALIGQTQYPSYIMRLVFRQVDCLVDVQWVGYEKTWVALGIWLIRT